MYGSPCVAEVPAQDSHARRTECHCIVQPDSCIIDACSSIATPASFYCLQRWLSRGAWVVRMTEYCGRCGYDVTKLPRCPECHSQSRVERPPRGPGYGLYVLCGGILLSVGIMPLCMSRVDALGVLLRPLAVAGVVYVSTLAYYSVCIRRTTGYDLETILKRAVLITVLWIVLSFASCAIAANV